MQYTEQISWNVFQDEMNQLVCPTEEMGGEGGRCLIVLCFLFLFLSDPSPIIVYPCHWLTHWLTDWLTDSLLFSRLYWCDPCVWRCQLKTCWCCNYCWWWSCWQQFVADLDAEVWSKAKLLFRHWAQNLVKILKLKFRQDLKLEFGKIFSADVL